MGVSTGGHPWVTTLPSRHPSPQPGHPAQPSVYSHLLKAVRAEDTLNNLS